jgi:DNA mismatch repair ATPase MutS
LLAARKYSELLEKYQAMIVEQTHSINLISNIRLVVFFVGTGLGIYFIVKKQYELMIWDLVIFLVLFIPLILLHDYYFNNRKYSIALHKINEDSLKRMRGEWNTFTDDGAEFWDDSHNYSQDLDIFGQGSLFQFINTAVTYLGRLKLKDFLNSPPRSVEEIISRQEAVRELSPKLDWRQKYMAEGMLEVTMHDPKELFLWANRRENFYRNPWVIFMFRLIPIITIVIGILTFINPVPQYYSLAAALVLQFIILKINTSQRGDILEVTHRFMENIKTCYKMLLLLEQEEYNSRHLQDLKNSLKSDQGLTASEQIQKLVKLAETIANRHNQFYFIFNILFLLDYQFVFALEKWKEKFGGNLHVWLEVVGEFEALSSLAVLQHDFPEWTTPELSENGPLFIAGDMGHPLLMNTCVTNDLKFEDPENILLITGSNMSGKSTLLRTVGINLVLAYAGGNVCAQMFKCSIMDIYTCMRVNDNLEKNISSFYAELLRIKMIVKAVEDGQIIFFLLDEIFKGTNSVDRHTGAKVLIKKLCKAKILGLVSTHDLELGDLEKENDKIKNYHFQEYYKNNNIFFDYRLRPGVSNTRNAAFLMKMAGIEFSEE